MTPQTKNDRPCFVPLDGDGLVAGWNAAAARFFGYSAHEIVGHRFDSLLATEEVARNVPQAMMQEAALLERADRPVEIGRQDGSRLAAMVTLSTFHDSTGRASGFIMAASDLDIALGQTRATRDPFEGHELEQILKSVLEQFPAGVIVHEPHTGRFLMRNASVASMMRDEKNVPPFPSAWHLDGRPLDVQELAGMRACRGETVRQELVLQRADGTTCTVIDSGAPIRDREGAIVAGVAVIIDISEEKQAEKERERLLEETQRAVHAREEVLAVVSHDLRNPLGAIALSATQLLRADVVAAPDRAHRLAERIAGAVERMDHIIRDLLDISRIESGRLVVEIGDHSAPTLLAEAVDMLVVLAAEKGVKLRLSAPSFAVVVRCDRERVLQVFSNLIGNALRFVEQGGVIEVGGFLRDDKAFFYVRDDGPGIDPQDLPHIFDRHWQAQRVDAKVGLGLGLAIAKGIVDAHGGRIWAESGTGRGSTFYFSLPKWENRR